MLKFPKGLYSDVRIEEVFTTKISFKKKDLQDHKVRHRKGVFIRVFDGNRWYYSSSTDLDGIQEQMDVLAEMATPHKDIESHPVVIAFEVHQEKINHYERNSVTDIPVKEKQELLEGYLPLLEDSAIVHYKGLYVDRKIIKTLYSSKGSSITFDKQTCGLRFDMELSYGENKNQGSISKGKVYFHQLKGLENFIQEEIEKNIEFIKSAEGIEPGEYTVLLSPEAAGVFTHESFGHKSESDFMVGDETMKREWALGKVVGPEILSIVDSGEIEGNGYVPYDDEGTKGRTTNIITKGVLTGRLHSAMTGALLEEAPTANARSISFQYEPIVRMTTTYIEKGDRPLSEIIKEISKGIYVESIRHGSGMSTFTIAPARSYLIEEGKITKPVKVSVVTGNVFETLMEVDALSEEFELLSFVGGGCGKGEQFPLPVGFGGPYTRVKRLKVQ